MARRMGPEAAYEMAQRTMEENPGASRAEMRAKAEQMVDQSRMPLYERSKLTDILNYASVLPNQLAEANIGFNTPMGPAGTPGYMKNQLTAPMTQADAIKMKARQNRMEAMGRNMMKMDLEKASRLPYVPPSDSASMLTERQTPSNPGGFNIGYEQVAKDMGYDQTMTERQTPSAPVSMQYDAAASAKLAELRGQSAFDVGFRQGLEDYQKMKGESPNIIDELSGSTEEANRARSAIFMGNMASTDIKRLGYAEAMEFAEREEKTGADKMLRQGMME